jgi:hypothetical protein
MNLDTFIIRLPGINKIRRGVRYCNYLHPASFVYLFLFISGVATSPLPSILEGDLDSDSGGDHSGRPPPKKRRTLKPSAHSVVKPDALAIASAASESYPTETYYVVLYEDPDDPSCIRQAESALVSLIISSRFKGVLSSAIPPPRCMHIPLASASDFDFDS